MAEHSTATFQVMNERRKCGELCDFEIKVQGKTFPIHRIVLNSCSEYFRTLFASEFQEQTEGFCEVRDVDADVVETCIEFMYTGHMDITVDVAINVLRLAHMWQLNDVVKLCEDLLCGNLDGPCCFLYRKLASLYNLKKLLHDCTKLIFSKIKYFQCREELADISYHEMESLLQAWKQHCDTWISDAPDRNRKSNILMKTKQLNKEFWKLCSKWGEYESNSSQFCEIVKQFQIEKLQVQDFIETVLEENHVKVCEICRQSVSQRFLNNIDGYKEISDENCLILKYLANNYNSEQRLQQQLTDYIIKSHERVFTRREFNELVPPDDFIVYMEHLKCTEMSSDKFSIITSWIRFSAEREEVFPTLFKDKPLTKKVPVNKRILTAGLSQYFFFKNPSVFMLEDVLFIKTLSQKYLCDQVEKNANEFIVENFPSIVQLPESMQLLSQDLILYLQNPRSYGINPSTIWDFIVEWVNYDPENRKGDFPAIFQALRLDGFCYRFIRENIRTCELVKESAECLLCLIDFLLRN